MNQYEMIAFIVFFAVIGGVIKSIVRARSNQPDAAGPAQDARLAKLEERVKALEAVVGDSTYELKQKLRDLEK